MTGPAPHDPPEDAPRPAAAKAERPATGAPGRAAPGAAPRAAPGAAPRAAPPAPPPGIRKRKAAQGEADTARADQAPRAAAPAPGRAAAAAKTAPAASSPASPKRADQAPPTAVSGPAGAATPPGARKSAAPTAPPPSREKSPPAASAPAAASRPDAALRGAPQTDAPQTDASQTDAPRTEAAQADAPSPDAAPAASAPADASTEAEAEATQKGERGYHHGDLRAALLDAAMTVLERDGVDHFSLRRVCAHAGVSHTANRNHFGDVAGLRAAVATLGFKRLGIALAAGAAAAGPARSDGAAAVMEAYVAFARGAPDLFRLMFQLRPADDRDGTAAEAARAALAAFHRAARGLELATPLPPLEDGRSPGIYLWTLAHGHAHLAVGGGHALAAPELEGAGDLPPEPDPRIAAARSSAGRAARRHRDAAAAAGRARPALPTLPDAPPREEAPEAPPPRPSPLAAPEFRRIAPRMRFSQPFAFESLNATPGAPPLATPKERR
ncbi:TetR/AcrR family transcriptional regulator [Rhodovulum sp. DZ06]|uniref:TetR/AcrR family transcriptional regulator n=1 Tax=Rhodovulum sp. DZ06 TaxID=3425126 RepID=UPI003D327BBF